jgi:starch synthase
MKILYAAAEALPYFKTGGLADVSRALPDALHRLGHDVRIVHPLYRGTPHGPLEFDRALGVPWPGGALGAEFLLDAPEAAAPALLVRQPGFFETGDPYADDPYNPLGQGIRFAFFARAVITYARAWGADVVHLNDWHTGLAPLYALIDGCDAPTVYAVHNLAYQGNYPAAILDWIGVPRHFMRAENGVEFHGLVSFKKAGLSLADQLVTVSPSYAAEIRTPAHGNGFDGLLRFRHRALHGILNGIDRDVWNPAADPHLPHRYNARTLSRKDECREALLSELGLEDGGPLLVAVSRLVHQKGLDLLLAALPALVEWGFRVAVVGSGEPAVERGLARAAAALPGRVTWVGRFDDPLAHRMYAGGDFFVMPSRYEPCGLGQMIAQRYGTPPIARATGGLIDTVEHDRTGFLFQHADPGGLLWAADAALARWRADGWDTLRRRCMRLDWSWSRSAARYLDVYRLAHGSGAHAQPLDDLPGSR